MSDVERHIDIGNWSRTCHAIGGTDSCKIDNIHGHVSRIKGKWPNICNIESSVVIDVRKCCPTRLSRFPGVLHTIGIMIVENTPTQLPEVSEILSGKARHILISDGN